MKSRKVEQRKTFSGFKTQHRSPAEYPVNSNTNLHFFFPKKCTTQNDSSERAKVKFSRVLLSAGSGLPLSVQLILFLFGE